MQVTEAHNLGFEAAETAVFTVDEVPTTHQEWSEGLATPNLSEIIGAMAVTGVRLQVHPDVSYTMARHPKESATRDWWAPDHIFHVDGTRWDVQPVLTVIGCRQADRGAPSTELLDTVRLLEITKEDGFWGDYGLQETDLEDLSSIFVDSTYHREALPFLKAFMKEDEQDTVAQTIKKDYEKADSSTPDEFMAKMDATYPPKAFDLVRQTPYSKQSSLFLDGGVRNSRLVGPNGEDYTDALHALRLKYLTGNTPRQLGLIKAVHWVANLCLVFPQIGTLHRANPGNDYDRELHLGFLSQAD